MPAPDRSRRADLEGVPGIVGGERRCKDRRESRHRTVHESDEARLHDLQHEAPAGVFVFFTLLVGRQSLVLNIGRPTFVTGLRVSEIAQELPNIHVGRSPGGQSVEPLGVALHLRRMLPHRLDAGGPDLPMRLAHKVAAHVLSANKRDMVAETLCEQVDQLPAMLAFFRGHVGEHRGGRGIFVAKRVREIREHPGILFLIADGERQDFGFAQVVKTLHADSSFRMISI